MKAWITALGFCFALLVSCSKSGIQPSPTETTKTAIATAIETVTVTATLEETRANEAKARIIIPDLKAIPDGAGWNGSIQAAHLVEKDGAAAIEFNEQDWNIVWLDGLEFTDGTIEFDAKGKSEPLQGSFIGVAFRIEDINTYDAVYFRPFNFQALDKQQKSHAVQYISSPYWPWDKLREEKPGQYEKPIEPAPDGDTWFHAKIVIEERKIRVYVNDADEPSLQVAELSDRGGGSVGVWCFGYGAVSNLQITPIR